MDKHFKRICNELDAEVFSGDILFDPKARNELKRFIARWGERNTEF